MAKNTKENNKGNGVALGVGLGLIAAMSAGAYYLYGTKEGKNKRVKIRGWALKAKGEVLEKLENLKEVNQEKYDAIIDTVSRKYAGIKSIDKSELDALVTDLKKHWKNIKSHLAAQTKPKVKAVKKQIQKALE